MEGIIFLIISLIIGSLFKGKENQKPPAKRPQQTPRPEVQPRQKTQSGNLKDLTKQLFEDLQKEIQQETKEFRQDPREAEPKPAPARPAPSRPERRKDPVNEPAAEIGTADQPVKRTGRLNPSPKTTSELKDRRPVSDGNHIFPESEEELARAIMFAEILGPPKAKRR